MDVRLHCAEAGAGETLILLHGNGEDSTYFVHQIPFLAKHFRVMAVDSRGHGRSPRGGGALSIEGFADDLADFMDERGIARAHLLGFSDGANVAMAFALRRPERVRKLILNGGNLNPWGMKPGVLLPVWLEWLALGIPAIFSRRARRRWELLNLMVTQPRLKRADLAALTMPALVIAGTDDMIRSRHTEAIARALPHGRLCVLPGSHFVARENPEAFNAAALKFLTEESCE